MDLCRLTAFEHRTLAFAILLPGIAALVLGAVIDARRSGRALHWARSVASSRELPPPPRESRWPAVLVWTFGILGPLTTVALAVWHFVGTLICVHAASMRTVPNVVIVNLVVAPALALFVWKSLVDLGRAGRAMDG